jgi:hypothetical protein
MVRHGYLPRLGKPASLGRRIIYVLATISVCVGLAAVGVTTRQTGTESPVTPRRSTSQPDLVVRVGEIPVQMEGYLDRALGTYDGSPRRKRDADPHEHGLMVAVAARASLDALLIDEGRSRGLVPSESELLKTVQQAGEIGTDPHPGPTAPPLVSSWTSPGEEEPPDTARATATPTTKPIEEARRKLAEPGIRTGLEDLQIALDMQFEIAGHRGIGTPQARTAIAAWFTEHATARRVSGTLGGEPITVDEMVASL